MTKKMLIIEKLHLFTGFTLILAGLISYIPEGISTTLSWAIFGAMYISMSDIGENSMSDTEKASINHKIRTAAAYLGAILSAALLIYYIVSFGG